MQVQPRFVIDASGLVAQPEVADACGLKQGDLLLPLPMLANGVNGQLANLSMGAVDNTLRFEHEPWRLSEAVPEICALDDLFPKLAFGVTDALLCQYRGEDRTLLHYAVALNQLRFSVDPVALDILSVYEIERARATNPSEGEKPLKTELYFNAALQELGVADTNRIQVVRLPKPGL